MGNKVLKNKRNDWKGLSKHLYETICMLVAEENKNSDPIFVVRKINRIDEAKNLVKQLHCAWD